MNKVTVYVLFSPAENTYYSKNSRSEYQFRELDSARTYATLEKLGPTLVQIRKSHPDVVPIPIMLEHQVDESFTRPSDRITIDLDPVKNEAALNHEEMNELQRQYDIDADLMTEKNWQRYKLLKQFYKVNGYASFDKKTKHLTWLDKEIA